jgi:hypothetical protein
MCRMARACWAQAQQVLLLLHAAAVRTALLQQCSRFALLRSQLLLPAASARQQCCSLQAGR